LWISRKLQNTKNGEVDRRHIQSQRQSQKRNRKRSNNQDRKWNLLLKHPKPLPAQLLHDDNSYNNIYKHYHFHRYFQYKPKPAWEPGDPNEEKNREKVVDVA
jgi:hypothetical protein